MKMKAKEIAREILALAKSTDKPNEMKENWRTISAAYYYLSQKDSMLQSEKTLNEQLGDDE